MSTPPTPPMPPGWPPPGYPPGPGGYPPRSRSKLPWILGGIALLLILMVGGCAAAIIGVTSKGLGLVEDVKDGITLAQQEQNQIRVVAERYASAITASDTDAAYAMLCPSARSRLSQAEFTSQVRALELTAAVVTDTTSASFNTVSVRGAADLLVSRAASSQTRRVSFVRTGDSIDDPWEVCPAAHPLGEVVPEPSFPPSPSALR